MRLHQSGYLQFARENPGSFRLFRFPPDGHPADRPTAAATARVAERVRCDAIQGLPVCETWRRGERVYAAEPTTSTTGEA